MSAFIIMTLSAVLSVEAPTDVTKWELGQLLTFPLQDRSSFFEVLEVLDDNHAVVMGIQMGEKSGVTRTPVELQWYASFILKAPTNGIIDGKRISLTGKFKVSGTMRATSNNGLKKTMFVITAEK